MKHHETTVNPSRRNIMTMLGFTTAGMVTTAESLAQLPPAQGNPGFCFGSPEFQEQVAQALERMAEAIRSGDMNATAVDIHSKAHLGEWLEHTVTIKVEIGTDEPST